MKGWEQYAACRGANTDLFFPDHENATEAKRICAACPVRLQCLDAHLGEMYGVWGGMSVIERRQERTRRRNAA